MLKDPSTYEAHPLSRFGVTEAEILLGPLSGWNVIHYFLKEIHYLKIDEETARQIAGVFKERVVTEELRDQPAELLLRIARDEFNLVQLDISPPHGDHVMQNFAGPTHAMVGSRCRRGNHSDVT